MKSIKHSRRKFLKSFGLGVAALSFSHLNFCTQKLAKKPNIIFILADDLGYGDLGCYGQTKIKTPNLDKLSAEGMRFTQHYSGSTVCAPSRCSLMTGYHTGHCYVRGNKPIEGYQLPIPEETQTIAKLVKQAGYTTGATGKWGLGGPNTTGHPNKQGFDYFYGYLGQWQAHFYYPDHLWENETKIEIPENADGKKEIFSHDLIVSKTVEFMRNHKDKPFFLFVPFTIPHAELAVPEDSLKEYENQFVEESQYPPGKHYGAQTKPRTAYAAMVTRMDRGIGQIMDLLKELGLEKDTIVLFSSDNGPHKEGGNDPKFFNSNGPFRGIKRDLYEGGIRVPLIVRWPAKIKAGKESHHISAFWDLLPTFCEIAGVPAPSTIDGISFFPELMGKQQTKHEFLYWEFHEQKGKQAIRMGDWKAVRLNVKENPNAPIELYNLKKDIHEDQNVAEDFPEIVEKMQEIFSKARTESEHFLF